MFRSQLTACLVLFALLIAGARNAQAAAREFGITAADRAHWAFQPVKRPPIPQFGNRQSAIANPLDAFLLAKLPAAGLAFSPPSQRSSS